MPLPLIASDIETAIKGADVLMIMVPFTAHSSYATLLAPYVTPDHVLLLIPGHTGGSLAFVREMRHQGVKGPFRCGETCTLAYVARKQAPDQVSVFKVAFGDFTFAAFPGKYQAELMEIVKRVYPMIEPVVNVLETGFMNGSTILHPVGMIMNAGWIEHTGGGFMYYSEGVTSAIARAMQAVDDERLAAMAALGVKGKSFIQYFYDRGATTREAYESGSMYRVVKESAPNRTIRAPASLDDRFLHEDIGFGLAPMSELGDMVGVGTPTMKALIHLAELVTGVDYATAGLTLEKMGLAHVPLNRLPEFLYEGE